MSDPTATTDAPSRRGGRRRLGLAALGVASALSLSVALGAPADVDRGFGRDGRATADAGGDEYAYALAVQPDGRIVVAGETSLNKDAVVFRLEPDGSPDRGFDGDGARAIDSGGYGAAHAVAIQPDGGIVVAGESSVSMTSTTDAGVYRLTSAGAPDPSFGTDGAQAIDDGGNEKAHALALQPDGSIVLAGSSLGTKNAAVWRLTPTGARDLNFGAGGTRAIDLGGTIEVANAVGIQPDGRIVVAGRATLNGVTHVLAARLTPTGAPDPSFGAGGIALLTSADGAYARALAIQPDGKIVIAGRTVLNTDATVYRLTSDGAPDASFGVDGSVRLEAAGSEDAHALAIQRDGKILVAGEASAGDEAFLARLRPDGSRDTGFGDNGRRIIGGGDVPAYAVALRGDGGILLAGNDSKADQDVVVHRLLGDGQAPGAPRASGGPTAQPPTPRCAGKRATIVGTGRRDRIRGTRGRDVIVALGGNDLIRGLGGNDLICAGAGNDVVFGGPGRDRLIGGPGRDRLVGGAGLDRLLGGPGRDAVAH